jgi:arylsulfatase A-like enzyme
MEREEEEKTTLLSITIVTLILVVVAIATAIVLLCIFDPAHVISTPNIAQDDNDALRMSAPPSTEQRPIILIIVDQLAALEYVPAHLRDTLPGLAKWRSRCINFDSHFANSLPCSSSRSIIYTGKSLKETMVTDNTNSNWQPRMVTVAEGLPTIGTHLHKANYLRRYIGKWHLDPTLNRKLFNQPVPTMNGQGLLHEYDLGTFNRRGDTCYDVRGGLYSDPESTETANPPGTIPETTDDPLTATDGALPYLRARQRDMQPFALFLNYENPHDITYAMVLTDKVNRLQSTTMQLQGEVFNSERYHAMNERLRGSVPQWNAIHRTDNDAPLHFQESIEMANLYGNDLRVYPPAAMMLRDSSFGYMYGIRSDDLEGFQTYQRIYGHCIRSVDVELERIYDQLDQDGWFDRAVIALTSDHGEYNGMHGLLQKASILCANALRVPLFMSAPQLQAHAGQSVQSVTSHIQLMGTLLSLAGVPFPKDQPTLFESPSPYAGMCLSVGYGALLLPIAKKFGGSESSSSLRQFNYMDIPAFSACHARREQGKLLYGGYYFSLLDLFKTLSERDRAGTVDAMYTSIRETLAGTDCTLVDATHALVDAAGVSPIAYAGTYDTMIRVSESDPFVGILFAAPQLVPISELTPNWLGCDPVFRAAQIHATESYPSRMNGPTLYARLLDSYAASELAARTMLYMIRISKVAIPPFDKLVYPYGYVWNLSDDPQQLRPLAERRDAFMVDVYNALQINKVHTNLTLRVPLNMGEGAVQAFMDSEGPT